MDPEILKYNERQASGDIVEACVVEKAVGLVLERLIRRALPLDWAAQREIPGREFSR